MQLSSYTLGNNIELAPGGNFPPIEQVAICICYDWCEPFLHLMPMDGIREAANEFIERFGVTKSLRTQSSPGQWYNRRSSEQPNDVSKS